MRFIIIILVTYLAYKFLKGLFITTGSQPRSVPRQQGQKGSGEDLVEDPCCHTYVPLSNSLKAALHGKTVYFCSRKCLDEFTAIQKDK